MQNIFTSIKCSEIIVYNPNENWYIILYDLFSRLCYIATCGPFCKDATHISDLFCPKNISEYCIFCLESICLINLQLHILLRTISWMTFSSITVYYHHTPSIICWYTIHGHTDRS